MAESTFFLAEMKSPDVDAYLARNDLVLIPTGSTEQHGPHSPLSTDVIIPTEVCRRVAPRVDALVAPAISYGISATHRGFRALVEIRVRTFLALIEDLVSSFADAGFRRIVFVNGHFPNYHPINMACLEVAPRLPDGTHAWGVSYWETLPPEQLQEYLGVEAGLHANIGETSAVMAVRPDLVDLDTAVEDWPDFPEFQSSALPTILAHFETRPGTVWRALPSGVWGDPRGSSVEAGERFYGWIAEAMVKHIEDVAETDRRVNRRN